MTEMEIMAAVGKLYSFLIPLVIMVVLFFRAVEESER